MAQPHYPSLQEVKQLLDSHEMLQYEQAIADYRKLPLLPYNIMWPPRMQRELYLARLTTEDVMNILQNQKDEIIQFTLRIGDYYVGESIDGEFPKGEEQDPDDISKSIQISTGVMRGFGPMTVCYYWLASQSDPNVLLTSVAGLIVKSAPGS